MVSLFVSKLLSEALKKWLPVNSSVNTHENYGYGTADKQEPLQSQEEFSDVMVHSQELLSQSE